MSLEWVCRILNCEFLHVYTSWVVRIYHCEFLQVYTERVGRISHCELMEVYTECVGRISHCEILQVHTDCVGRISHCECFAGAHGMVWSHFSLRVFAGMIGLMRETNLTKWGESVINLHKLDEFNTVSPLFNENLIPVF